MLKLLDIKYLDIYNCLLYPFKVKTKMCFLKFCPQGDILSLEEPYWGNNEATESQYFSFFFIIGSRENSPCELLTMDGRRGRYKDSMSFEWKPPSHERACVFQSPPKLDVTYPFSLQRITT